MDSRWFNGRVVGTATIGGFLFTVLTLVVPDLRAWVTRQWSDGWPQAQVLVALAFLTLVIAVISAQRKDHDLQRELHAAQASESEMRIELEDLRAIAAALERDILEADRRLFRELVLELPSSHQALEFLRGHDFGATFDFTRLYGLFEFTHGGWDDPEHIFHDEALDVARARLVAAVENLLSMIAHHTGPVGGMQKRQGVAEAHILDTVRLVDSESNQRLIREIDELNKAADVVLTTHSELLTLGRRRLRI